MEPHPPLSDPSRHNSVSLRRGVARAGAVGALIGAAGWAVLTLAWALSGVTLQSRLGGAFDEGRLLSTPLFAALLGAIVGFLGGALGGAIGREQNRRWRGVLSGGLLGLLLNGGAIALLILAGVVFFPEEEYLWLWGTLPVSVIGAFAGGAGALVGWRGANP